MAFEKVKLLYDGYLEVNDECCVVIEKDDTVRVVTKRGIDNTVYKRFSVLTDELLLMKGLGVYALYNKGKLECKTEKSIDVAMYIKNSLGDNIVNVKLRNERDCMSTINRKIDMYGKFIGIELAVGGMITFNLLYNADGKRLVDFSEGYYYDELIMGDYAILHRYEEYDIPEHLYSNYDFKNKVDKLFNSNKSILIDTQGNIIFAVNTKMKPCGTNRFIMDSRVFEINKDKIQCILNCSDYNANTVDMIGHNIVALGKSYNGAYSSLVNLETGKVWYKCKYLTDRDSSGERFTIIKDISGVYIVRLKTGENMKIDIDKYTTGVNVNKKVTIKSDWGIEYNVYSAYLK